MKEKHSEITTKRWIRQNIFWIALQTYLGIICFQINPLDLSRAPVTGHNQAPTISWRNFINMYDCMMVTAFVVFCAWYRRHKSYLPELPGGRSPSNPKVWRQLQNLCKK